MKEEDINAKGLEELIKPMFETRSNRTRYCDKRVWLPMNGESRDVSRHMFNKSKYFIKSRSMIRYVKL